MNASEIDRSLAVNRLLRPSEVAQSLLLSERMLRKLAASGEISSVRVSERCLRFRREDVEEFVMRRRDLSDSGAPA